MKSHWSSFRSMLMQRWSARFRRPDAGDLLAIALTMAACLFSLLVALYLISGIAVAMPLSAGDRIMLTVASGEEFSGKYQVDVQGHIQMPYAGLVQVAGMEPDAAAAAVSDALVRAGLFRKNYVRSSMSVLAWAPIQVVVSGAVFYPGAHRINLPIPRDRAPDRAEELPGAAVPERRLSDALRTAGGVTPWADIAHVVVRRRGVTHLFDMWGVVRGEAGLDPALEAGDEVLVPTLALPQAALARPTIITPPGIKVFISNLTQPAQSNSQSTVSGGSLSLAYGSRLSQAVVASNCVGGVSATSGDRAAVLVRTDRVTGTTTTLDVPVEQLIRGSHGDNNPILLEGDAVACYDSRVTGIREVFRALSDFLSPLSIIVKGVRL